MDAKVVKALHQVTGSNLPAMLINLAGVAVAIASIAIGWPTEHWLWYAFVVAWLAYFHHTWMTIFHEDAHFALYQGKSHNVRNGTIVGTLLMVPFTVYRQVHIRHHNRMNCPEDWELWPYCDPNKSLSFRRMFLFFDIFFGLWVGPVIYWRIFFAKNSPLTDPKIRRRITLEFLLIFTFWAGLLAAVAFYNAWWMFVKVYLIPAYVAGVVQTIRKLTEHLGLPEGDAMAGARTVLTDGPIGRAFSYTSFHIASHGLHHQYPQMPHENLEKAFKIEEETNQDAPVFPSHFRAMLDMTRHLAHPGIGVNAEVHSNAN
ncbi:MAG: fatty acid desaturase family protein [Phycisphaerae bacterium]